jgi:ATP-dependent RNA helicase DDX46/PRP5
VQISRECKLFFKAMGLSCCAAYGGSQVKDQINELKRGVDAVVCTPGRMIDVLVTSNGTITNLRRVTMLVIDEADRMFDMGFEPQINRIIAQIRPDRQTVLFSATFPRQVEVLARAILDNPVEILVRPATRARADAMQVA